MRSQDSRLFWLIKRNAEPNLFPSQQPKDKPLWVEHANSWGGTERLEQVAWNWSIFLRLSALNSWFLSLLECNKSFPDLCAIWNGKWQYPKRWKQNAEHGDEWDWRFDFRSVKSKSVLTRFTKLLTLCELATWKFKSPVKLPFRSEVVVLGVHSVSLTSCTHHSG